MKNTTDLPETETIKQPEPDNLFCVPLEPPSPPFEPAFKLPQAPVESSSAAAFKEPALPVQDKKAAAQQPPQPPLNYNKPEWSTGRPPAGLDAPSELDAEGFCSHYFLEVLKSGVIVQKIKLTKEFTSFGRLDTCDVLCEHPSLSRYHAILQYSSGEHDPAKFPEGFYLFDLNSTHGTFINKSRIKPNEYVRITNDSMFKLGLSTRLFVLHGPKPKNFSEDLNINLTHEQMRKIREKYGRIAVKLRMRKEMDADEMERELSKAAADIDWGFKDEDGDEALANESQDEDQQNPFSVIEEQDESFYSDDPKKALKNFFDREGDELEYEFEELGPGKFKCRVRLPIRNNYGEDIYAECEHQGKKKDCMTVCALEACRILNSKNLLKSSLSSQERARRKREKNWENDDFYDSDEDNFFDRTGELERKRAKRMAAAGKLSDDDASAPRSSSSNVHTFDSIQSDMRRLYKEQSEIESKLEQCKDVIKAVNEDDLDAYIRSLKVGTLDTVTRAKFKKRLVEIVNELSKLEKLLKVAKPSGFDILKWKESVHNELRNREPEVATRPASPSKRVAPVQEAETKAEQKSQTNEPEGVIESNLEAKENVIQQPTSSLATSAEKQATSVKEMKRAKKPVVEREDEEDESPEPNDNYEKLYQTNNKEYAVWLPPQDQTGDGKTKLNEKYGY